MSVSASRPQPLWLITGPSGTGVKQSLNKYAEFAGREGGPRPTVIDLDEGVARAACAAVGELDLSEDEGLRWLLCPRPKLRRIWEDVFQNQVIPDVESAREQSPVLLCAHLSYYSHLLREFVLPFRHDLLTDRLSHKLTGVITLIDDVYDCHRRLSRWDNGIFWARDRGQAIMQLLKCLDWRGIEIMLSDGISASCSNEEGSRVPHYVFAVKHRLRTFHDLLQGRKQIVYLSHPISEIRRMYAVGTANDALDLINGIEHFTERLRHEHVVVEPTAIDELRLEQSGGSVTGRLLPRWPLRNPPDGVDACLAAPCPSEKEVRSCWLPAGWEVDVSEPEQAADVQRMAEVLYDRIYRQVGARDHYLVEQSQSLVCYRPLFQGNESSGVKEELQHLGRLRKVAAELRHQPATLYSPLEDKARFAVRQFADVVLPQWVLSGKVRLQGGELDAVAQRVRAAAGLRDIVLAGDGDQLFSALAEHGIECAEGSNDDLARGALGTDTAAHERAAQAELAREAATRCGHSYVDGLVDDGVATVYDDQEQMFDVLRKRRES